MTRLITSKRLREAAETLRKKPELGKGDFVKVVSSDSDLEAQVTYCMMGAIGHAMTKDDSIDAGFFSISPNTKFFKAVQILFPDKFPDIIEPEYNAGNEWSTDLAIDAVATFNDANSTTLEMAVDKLHEIANVMDSL